MRSLFIMAIVSTSCCAVACSRAPSPGKSTDVPREVQLLAGSLEQWHKAEYKTLPSLNLTDMKGATITVDASWREGMVHFRLEARFAPATTGFLLMCLPNRNEETNGSYAIAFKDAHGFDLWSQRIDLCALHPDRVGAGKPAKDSYDLDLDAGLMTISRYRDITTWSLSR